MIFFPTITYESFSRNAADRSIRYERHQQIGKMSFVFDVVSWPTHAVARAWSPQAVLLLKNDSPFTRPNLYNLYPGEHPQAMFLLDAIHLARAVKEKYQLRGNVD